MVNRQDGELGRAVFLLGGKGTRLGLVDRPKPMVEIDGKPLLERLVESVAGQGFRDMLFLCGYRADAIRAHFGDGARFGVRIEYVVEDYPLGTAGAVRAVAARLSAPFLVFYGDVLFDIDIAKFVAYAAAKGGCGTLYTHPNDHPFDSDLVEVDGSGRIVAFHAKPHGSANHANLASAAVYYLTPEALAHVPSDAASDWGRDVFPSIVSAGGALYSYRGSEYLKDVGTPDRLARAKRGLRAGLPARRSYRARQRAIFLDRDGVLNEEIDGVYAADQLKLLESAAAGVKAINQKGLLAICVTNQPGLAKGFFDFATLADVHRRLDVMLAQEGAYLDDIYVCPHHPERGFEGEVATLKIDCECRKPQPGLLKQAAEFHNIDLVSSCIIGDRVIDIAAGAAVGAKGYLVNNRDPADAMAVEALQGTVVDGGLQAALQAIFEPHDQTRGSAAC